jgi:hypothetical protein
MSFYAPMNRESLGAHPSPSVFPTAKGRNSMEHVPIRHTPTRKLTQGILSALTLICCASVALVSGAQSLSTHPIGGTRIVGKQDSDLPSPPVSVIVGRKDTSALAALTKYVSQLSLTSITGVQATGTFTDQFSSSPATLTYDNQGSVRLDVSTNKGQTSIRMQGGYGAILGASGSKHTLTSETASGGWLPSPLLLLLKYNDAQTTVVDQGLVNTSNGALYRITLAFPALSPSASTQQTTIIDVYLNPSTNLVTKTVSAIRLDTRDRASYLQVVTFSGYRLQSGSLLPFSYSVSLNGQPQWTLQLDNVSLNPSLTPSYFRF